METKEREREGVRGDRQRSEGMGSWEIQFRGEEKGDDGQQMKKQQRGDGWVGDTLQGERKGDDGSGIMKKNRIRKRELRVKR